MPASRMVIGFGTDLVSTMQAEQNLQCCLLYYALAASINCYLFLKYGGRDSLIRVRIL